MIRPESPADAAAIHAVTAAAFRDAPHADHNEQHIVDALRAVGALTLSLVVAFPASQSGNALIRGHGRPPACLLAVW